VGGTSAAEEECAAEESGSAWVAQLVERVLGKDEVTGSIPVPGSRICGLDGSAAKRFAGEFFKGVKAPGGGNSTVESHSSKVMVAGSNPVPRSKLAELTRADRDGEREI
jgi:hypothetical protein